MVTKKAPKKQSSTVSKNIKSTTKNTAKKKEAAPPAVPAGLVTIGELSKRTGVGIRMLRTLQQQGIIEPEVTSKGKESLYNFAACLAKMFAYYRDLANSNKSTDSQEMKDEKLKQITAKRMLEEIKVRRIRGDLHHTEDIKRIVGSMFSRVHASLESFPLGIAPLLVDKTDAIKIAETIRKRISKILYEITNFDFNEFEKMNADYFIQLAAQAARPEEEDDDGSD